MIPEPAPRQRRWLIVAVLAAVAVVIAAIALIVTLTRDTNESGTATTTSAGTPSGSMPPRSTTASPSSSPGPAQFAYQPLFPFAGVAEADAWVREARPGGHQPWHDDAGMIAVMFAQQYLGYQHIDKVTKTTEQREQAWVGVGFTNPNGDLATAAVLHLVQIGSAPGGPWEVVGSEDTTLAVTTPGYGSTVTSPVRVGGRVTGVDESLQVQVIGGAGSPAGTVAPIPAGGTDSPWTATVPFTASCPATLTIAVATGGHIAEVERFAVTGVRC